MNRQQSLFDDMVPEQPENKCANSTGLGLKILPTKGQALGKAQKAFNRLVARVEQLRKALATQTARLDAALMVYSTKMHPLKKRETELRKEMVRLVFPFFKNRLKPPLGKRQREVLRELLSGNLDTIAGEEGGLADADLQEMFSMVEGMSVEDAKDQALDEMRGNVREAFAMMGMDVDLSGMSNDMSPEEAGRLQRELLEKMQEAQARMEEQQRTGGGGDGPGAWGGRARRKTKKQLAAEAREQAMEEARKRSIGSIYKQLARAFHPDLEPDPERRAGKEVLMKELTAAYKAGDLHTLLRLELEWIHREEGDAARLTDEKLEIYNSVLKEQIQDLERELHELSMHPRYEVLLEFAGPFDGLKGIDAERMLMRMRARLAALENSVGRLRDRDTATEVRIMLRQRMEEMRERALNDGMEDVERIMRSVMRGGNMR
jgi:hypothetical protein